MSKITLALTGSFGCGKSQALKYFKRLGATTIDCDQIAHQLTTNKSPKILNTIIETFGAQTLNAQGHLDRIKMANLIFDRAGNRQKLEKILHPKIMNKVKQRLKQSTRPIRVVETPLLFEAQLQNFFDATIAIWAPKHIILQRLTHCGYPKRTILKRWQAQLPLKKKCQKADFILDNTNTPRDLKHQVNDLYKTCQFILKSS